MLGDGHSSVKRRKKSGLKSEHSKRQVAGFFSFGCRAHLERGPASGGLLLHPRWWAIGAPRKKTNAIGSCALVDVGVVGMVFFRASLVYRWRKRKKKEERENVWLAYSPSPVTSCVRTRSELPSTRDHNESIRPGDRSTRSFVKWRTGVDFLIEQWSETLNCRDSWVKWVKTLV